MKKLKFALVGVFVCIVALAAFIVIAKNNEDDDIRNPLALSESSLDSISEKAQCDETVINELNAKESEEGDKFVLYQTIGSCNVFNKNYTEALVSYKKSLEFASGEEQTRVANESIDNIQATIEMEETPQQYLEDSSSDEPTN